MALLAAFGVSGTAPCSPARPPEARSPHRLPSSHVHREKLQHSVSRAHPRLRFPSSRFAHLPRTGVHGNQGRDPRRAWG